MRTHSPGGLTLPKITYGLVRGGARRVRSARERAAEARRLVSMSRPSFGGVGALREGDHEHQRGRHHLRQEAHVPGAESLECAHLIVYIIN